MARGQRPQQNYKAKRQSRSETRDKYWREVIGNWKDSGLNVRDFCRREDLREPQFYAWRRELRLRDLEVNTVTGPAEATLASSNPFVPLRVVPETIKSAAKIVPAIEIRFAGGASMQLQDDCRLDLVAKLLLEMQTSKC